MFKRPTKGVVYECSDCSKLSRGAASDRFAQLMSSTFAIVPHGDGRWNMRFSEVIGARSIPVVIADGITLPFEQLIDWSHAAVSIEESVVENAKSPDVGGPITIDGKRYKFGAWNNVSEKGDARAGMV